MTAALRNDVPSHDEPESIELGGISLVADCGGAIFWPEEGLLAVADLHFEKGSSFARYGIFLPPFDTKETLARLATIVERYRPRVVIALGDSFHDGDGPERLPDGERDMLHALQRGRDWIWIAGNHDPDPAARIGGSFTATLAIGELMFRHEPTGNAGESEIAGHLHPIARVATRARTVSRRCFACDGTRLVMPAFGAFTGGLNVRDRAFAKVFGTFDFTAHVLGEKRLYAVAAGHCLGD